MVECKNLDEVRENIDRLDREIVRMIAERSYYVMQAAKFKTTKGDVKAPKRVEEVISKVRYLAAEKGLDPDMIEDVYRIMIEYFINYEMEKHGMVPEP